MVKQPVETTLETELPLMEPKSALEMAAVFAGPAVKRPPMEYARSMKYRPAPVCSKSAPNTKNRMM